MWAGVERGLVASWGLGRLAPPGDCCGWAQASRSRAAGRRPSPRPRHRHYQASRRRRRHRVGHIAAPAARRRPHRRGVHSGSRRWPGTVLDARAVRLLQRHRPHRNLQRAPQAPPAQPARQPQTEPRPPPGRSHPGPPRHPPGAPTTSPRSPRGSQTRRHCPPWSVASATPSGANSRSTSAARW